MTCADLMKCVFYFFSLIMLLKYVLCFICTIITSIYCEDVKVPYFHQVTLECTDSSVNLTNYDPANLHSRYWIFPSGKVYDNDNSAPICGRNKCWEMNPLGFNVTIKRINDDDFGVYYCVLVLNDSSIRVLRKGLNVDGPYYGDLLEKYKENAKIGGIAAAVLFIIVGGSCFLWNCRYNKRKSKMNKENGNLTDINMVHTYENRGTDFDPNERL